MVSSLNTVGTAIYSAYLMAYGKWVERAVALGLHPAVGAAFKRVEDMDVSWIGSSGSSCFDG